MRNPPIQPPTIAGAPATSASAASRARLTVRSACDRCSDAESFRDVVDHESDDQERSERELTECDRRADRESLAEVVEPDPDGDERGQGHALEWRAPLALAATERR